MPPRIKFQKKNTYYLEEQAPSLSESDTEGAYSLFSLTSAKNQPICFTVCMNGVLVKMQLDTGASLSVISEGTNSKLRDIGIKQFYSLTFHLPLAQEILPHIL